jgi:hypothetical protein
MKNNELEKMFADTMKKITKGNPGCLMLILDLMNMQKNNDNSDEYAAFLGRMGALEIVGDKLYLFWNDCCNRNTKKAVKIGIENSKEDIEKHINYKLGVGIPYED